MNPVIGSSSSSSAVSVRRSRRSSRASSVMCIVSLGRRSCAAGLTARHRECAPTVHRGSITKQRARPCAGRPPRHWWCGCPAGTERSSAPAPRHQGDEERRTQHTPAACRSAVPPIDENETLFADTAKGANRGRHLIADQQGQRAHVHRQSPKYVASPGGAFGLGRATRLRSFVHSLWMSHVHDQSGPPSDLEHRRIKAAAPRSDCMHLPARQPSDMIVSENDAHIADERGQCPAA